MQENIKEIPIVPKFITLYTTFQIYFKSMELMKVPINIIKLYY